jgi:hypothetical protein
MLNFKVDENNIKNSLFSEMSNVEVELSDKINNDIEKLFYHEKVFSSAFQRALDTTFQAIDIKEVLFNNEFVAKNQKITFYKVDNDYVLGFQPDTDKEEDKKNLYTIMDTKYEEL